MPFEASELARGILEIFAEHLPGVAYEEHVIVRRRHPPTPSDYRQIDRDLKAMRARRPAWRLEPLPRVRCSKCGRDFGTVFGVREHVRRTHAQDS